MVTDALGSGRGLEALTWMSTKDVRAADGFGLPVTVFTVLLATGLDPGLRAEPLGGPEYVGVIQLLDPRSVPEESDVR